MPHVDGHLPYAESQPYRVDGHGRLQTEPRRQRTTGLESLPGDRALARQRLFRVEPGDRSDGPAGERLDQPEPTALLQWAAADSQVQSPRDHLLQQGLGLGRRLSDVSVHQQVDVSRLHSVQRRVDGAALAQTPWGDHDPRARPGRLLAGTVGGAIGDHDDLRDRLDPSKSLHGLRDGVLFVEGCDDGHHPGCGRNRTPGRAFAPAADPTAARGHGFGSIPDAPSFTPESPPLPGVARRSRRPNTNATRPGIWSALSTVTRCPSMDPSPRIGVTRDATVWVVSAATTGRDDPTRDAARGWRNRTGSTAGGSPPPARSTTDCNAAPISWGVPPPRMMRKPALRNWSSRSTPGDPGPAIRRAANLSAAVWARPTGSVDWELPMSPARSERAAWSVSPIRFVMTSSATTFPPASWRARLTPSRSAALTPSWVTSTTSAPVSCASTRSGSTELAKLFQFLSCP